LLVLQSFVVGRSSLVKEKGMAFLSRSKMAAQRGSPPRRPGRLGRHEERVAYLFLMPWFAGLICFLAIPLLWSVWVSLSSRQLLRPGRFVGLQNYLYMFTEDRFFYHTLAVTVRWLLLTTPLYLVTGIALGLLLNQKLRGMNLFRTILYIPAVLSGVAVTILWRNLLNPDLGAVNFLLRRLGVDNPPYWFLSPTWAMPGLALIGLWGIGGSAVIYLAGLQNIPPHLYEAAAIDGAGPLAKFRYITLPMLSPTIFFLLITGVIDAFQIFGPAFVFAGGTGGPADSLLFYMLYLYRIGFMQGFMGYAAALAWVLTIIGCITVYFLFKLEKRFVFYETDVR
jgi:multiple sugar transport system permease protein